MKELLERLSEAFVMADPGDREALVTLRHRLGQLSPLAPLSGVRERLAEMGRRLDLLISGSEADPEAAWELLAKGISFLEEQAQRAPKEETAPGPRETLENPAGPAGQESPEGKAPPFVPGSFDPDIFAGFVGEAREHLDLAEAQLLLLEQNPTQASAIHTVFRAFHTIKGAAGCLDLLSFQGLAHETESLLELARRGTLEVSGVVMDLVFESLDMMKLLVRDVEVRLETGTEPAAPPGLEALVLRIREQDRSPRRAARPEPSVSAAGADAGQGARAGSEVPPGGDTARRTLTADASLPVQEPVRVDADRLDRLVTVIGELVIAESMVSQSSEMRGLSAGGMLEKSLSQLDKITRELQEMGMSLRMVPVRPLFRKMARLVRDLSHKLSRPVEFLTFGEEIEIDRAIVNCVTDALVHLLRNALDHGVEADSAGRLRAGKPALGRLELRASHREGSIVIEVRDDGRGLDRDALLAKGIEKGFVEKGETLSEADIFRLIFLPGFSTASVVTELSGRGVGLDVVRTSVEALRGRIEVTSRRGQGTAFQMRLPLTMAVIDGMVLRAGGERFVVPTSSITRLVRPGPGTITIALGQRELLSLDDELVPLFRLGQILDVSAVPEESASEVAVVVEDGGRRAALLADEVLGQQQIVIKNLGMALERAPGISGGVILPDGQVGLILDVRGLLSRTRSSRPARSGAPAQMGQRG